MMSRYPLCIACVAVFCRPSTSQGLLFGNLARESGFILVVTVCKHLQMNFDNYLPTDWRTYLLTPWSKFLLEKLIGSQLVKILPALYGTRRFVTAYKCPPPVPILSQLDPVYAPISHFTMIHLNITFLYTPGSPQWFLSLRFPHHNPVHIKD